MTGFSPDTTSAASAERSARRCAMSRSPRRFHSLLALPALLALAVSGVQAAPHSQAAASLVKVAPGKILKNAKGLTLYVFASDPPNKSTCYDTCAKYWPPALVPSGT